jgi:hypothetical protein
MNHYRQGRQTMSNYQAKFGSPRGSVNGMLAIDGEEVIHKHPRYFKMLEDRYPLSGAKASVKDDGSGWRNQLHQFTLLITFADGRELFFMQTLKGAVARTVVAQAQRFATAVNNAAIAAESGKLWRLETSWLR